MHKLSHEVRFSINPFLAEDSVGFNTFASRPAGRGLAFFLELSAELTGEPAPDTGFVVNVSDIDSKLRRYAVPVFAERIKGRCRAGRHIGFVELTELLCSAWQQLSNKFGGAVVSGLGLKLNPYRRLSIENGDGEMVYFSEKFEFAAAHKLWNEQFSESENVERFGRCANPTGHGHNYVAEVTIKAPVGEGDLKIADFERAVSEELIEVVDHKNLNADVAEFRETNPTVENISVFAWNKLVGGFGKATLHCVTVWETDKTCCTCYG